MMEEVTMSADEYEMREQRNPLSIFVTATELAARAKGMIDHGLPPGEVAAVAAVAQAYATLATAAIAALTGLSRIPAEDAEDWRDTLRDPGRINADRMLDAVNRGRADGAE